MPRNAQGLYTLPAGNPVESGTVIESQWANTTMEDIALAITGSLPRDGSAPMTGPLMLASSAITQAQQATSKAYVDQFLAYASGMPIGAVAAFAGATGPAGWIKCDGQAVSRTTYASLFAAIGTTYGSGNGTTTFNVPDLRGEFVRGRPDTRAVGSKQVSSIAAHVHAIVDPGHVHTASQPSHDHTLTTAAHTHNLQGDTGAVSGTHTHRVAGATNTESNYHTHPSTPHDHQFAAWTFTGGNYAFNTGGGAAWSSTQRTDMATDTVGNNSQLHTHTFDVSSYAETQAHSHPLSGPTTSATVTGSTDAKTPAVTVNSATTGITGTSSTGGTETVPQNTAMDYYIKAVQDGAGATNTFLTAITSSDSNAIAIKTTSPAAPTTPQLDIKSNVANGLVKLDSSAKIPSNLLPAAVTSASAVAFTPYSGIAATNVQAAIEESYTESARAAHVGATGNAHGDVTTSASGFMSAADKVKLDGIQAGAQVNTVASVAGRQGAVTLTVGDVAGAAPINSPALTGVPTAPTAAVGTNTVQVATTQFVTAAVAEVTGGVTPSNTNPSMNGVAAPGVATQYSRGDHVHPTDTSRAPINSPTFTGIPAGPTATPGTATTQLATTAFVAEAVVAGGGVLPSNSNPAMNGTAAPGSSALYSRGDHVHPTDTSRAPATHVGDVGAAHGAATAAVAGFMSAADKSKLDGIAAGAQVNTVTSVAGRQGAVTLAVADVSGAAPLASPTFTGTPAGPTASAGTNTTQLATTAFVTAAVAAGGGGGGGTPSDANPSMNGVAAPGTSTNYSRGDHVHPTDTSRAPATHVGDVGTAHGVATTTTAGFMSAADKSKLDSLSNYTLPVATASVLGGVKDGTGVSIAGDGTINAEVVLAANSFTGIQTFGAATREKQTALGAGVAINCALGAVFSKTISGNAAFSISGAAASGNVTSFILDLTNGGSATINWWSGVKWAGGVAPVLTASGRDVLGFFTYDGGTTWTGLVLGKDVK